MHGADRGAVVEPTGGHSPLQRDPRAAGRLLQRRTLAGWRRAGRRRRAGGRHTEGGGAPREEACRILHKICRQLLSALRSGLAHVSTCLPIVIYSAVEQRYRAAAAAAAATTTDATAEATAEATAAGHRLGARGIFRRCLYPCCVGDLLY